MKKYIHLTLVLFIISALSGLILSTVNDLTIEPIRKAEEAKRNEGISIIFPDLDSNKTKLVEIDKNENIIEYYEVNDKDGNVLGYVFNVDAPDAYKKITFLVGIDTSGNIKGTSYLSLDETPGLGLNVDPKKASNKEIANRFNNQFVGLSNVDDVDTISGATLSSSSVVEGIKIVIDYFNTNIKSE